MAGRDQIIVALDVPQRDRTLELARAVREHVGMAKIGLEGFVAHGPDLVKAVWDLGLQVFLDLKVHDIPRTAAAAAREASQLGAKLLTVHAGGGGEMIRAAREAAGEGTHIIAVTVLTSLDEAALAALGHDAPIAETARRYGEVALQHGADGLVCSAHELSALAELGGSRVVPGVRPARSAAGDQKRVATPPQAVAQGATWLVIGRPITEAADPAAAAAAIAESLS